MNLNKDYWSQRWQAQETGWDIGGAAPALTEYMTQVTDKNVDILLPGCGRAHELKALLDMGFSNITLIDIAPEPVRDLQEQFKNEPAVTILCDDFFRLQGAYDIILEQTFFCALSPSLRTQYVKQMHALLKPKGKLVGVLFDVDFQKEGPPFGGSMSAYQTLFEHDFYLKTMAPCYNSIAPRAGTEVFFIAEKS